MFSIVYGDFELDSQLVDGQEFDSGGQAGSLSVNH